MSLSISGRISPVQCLRRRRYAAPSAQDDDEFFSAETCRRGPHAAILNRSGQEDQEEPQAGGRTRKLEELEMGNGSWKLDACGW